jgi:hypothetical protein
MPDLKQALKDFVATSNSGKYADEKVLISKFPELKDYDIQALKDFVATSNSGKYKSEDELLSKFPEFNIKTTATPPPQPPTGPQPETPQPRNKIAEMLNQPKAVDRLKQVVPTSEVTSGTKVPQRGVSVEVAKQEVEQEVKAKENLSQRVAFMDVEKLANDRKISTSQLFDETAPELLKYLPEDKVLEYELIAKEKKLTADKAMLIERMKATNNPNTLGELNKTKVQEFKTKFQRQKLQEVRREGFNKEIAKLDALAKQMDQEGKTDVAEKLRQDILATEGERDGYFKNPNEQIQKIYSDNKSDMDEFQVPGNTPLERTKNYALILQKQISDLNKKMEGDGIKQDGSMLEGISKVFDDQYQFYSGKKAKLEAKLAQVAPIALLNQLPQRGDDGFFNKMTNSIFKELLPDPVMSRPENLTFEEIGTAIKANQISMSLSDDLITEGAIGAVNQMSEKPEAFSAPWWGELTGNSLALMPAFLIGNKASAAAKVPALFEKVAVALKAQKYGKYLSPIILPAEKGLEYAAAKPFLSENLADEASFLSGYLGQAISGPVGSVLSSAPITNLFNKMFGSSAPIVYNQIKALGNRVSSGLGEYGEEVGNTLGPILETYIAGQDFGQLKKDLSENFGELDANLELFVGSVVMGMAMGGGSGIGKASIENSKKIYNQLPPAQQKKADAIANALKNDIEKAEVQARKEEIQEGAEPLAEDILTEEDKQKKTEAIEKLNNPASTVAEKVEAGTVLHNIEIKEHNANITEKALEEVAGEEVVSEEAVVETPSEEVAVEETPIVETPTQQPQAKEEIIETPPSEAVSEEVITPKEEVEIIENKPINKIQQDAEQVINGEKVFERFSQDEQRGFVEGGPNHVEAAILLATNEGTSGENNTTAEAQEKRIEEYSKEKGTWTEGTTKTFNEKYGEPIASGEEAIVWADPDRGVVVKTQDTFQYENLQQKLDAITLHNTYFPSAPIKVLGYGKNAKGEFQVIVEQPFVKGEKLTINEIHDYLESVGFKKDANGNYVNGETIVEDVHTGNAIRTPEGNIVVIDPIMRLNVAEQGYGGVRKVGNKVSPKQQAKEVVSEEVKQETPKKEVVKEQPKKVPAKKKPLTKQEKETIVKDRLLDRLSAYNKLSAFQQKTKGPSADIVDIIGIASKYGFIIKDANVLKPNRTKKYELFKDGKRVGKSQTKSNIPEATPEQVKVAEKLIDKDLVTMWNGDTNTTRLDAVSYGITWAEIRQGEKDIKAGKLNSVPAKRLIQVLNQIEASGDVSMIVGSGGSTIDVGYRLSEARQRMKEFPEITDSDMEEINANLDTLAKEYDEWFAGTLTEQEQNNILEENESRNQSEISENAEVGQGKTNVSNEKDGTEGKGEEVGEKPKKSKPSKKEIQELSSIGVTNFNLPNLVEEVKQMSKTEFVAAKGSEFESKEQAESYWEDTRNGIFNKEVSDLKNTIDIEVRKSRNDLGSFKVGSGKMWTAMGKLMGLYVKKGVTSFGDFIKATGYKATSAMKSLWDSVRGRKSTIKLSTKNANIRNINARLFYTEALDGIPSTDDAQVILDALKDTIDVYKTMSIHAAKNDVQDINNATDALTDLYVELSSDLEIVKKRIAEELELGQKVFEAEKKLSVSEKLAEYFADDFRWQEKMQKEIEKTKGTLPDDMNPYIQKDIAIGRMADTVNRVYQKIFGKTYGEMATNKKGTEGMVQRMAKDKLNITDLDFFMMVQHAKERNARVKAMMQMEKDAEVQKLQDELADLQNANQLGLPGVTSNTALITKKQKELAAAQAKEVPYAGSGMTDAEADNFMKEFEKAGKKDKLEAYAKEFRETVIQKSIDLREEAGDLSPEEAEALRTGKDEVTGVDFEFYIPLKVKQEALPDKVTPSGKRGASFEPIQKIKGTNKYDYTKRISPVTQSLLDFQASVKLSEDNKVAQSLYNLVKENPNNAVWEIVDVAGLPGGEFGLPSEIKDNSVKVKIGGKVKYIKFNHQGLRDAWLKNNADKSSAMRSILRIFNMYNSFKRAILTQYNPEFAFTNVLRDVQDVIFNAAGVNIEGLTTAVIKNYKKATKASFKATMGNLDPNSEMGKVVDEYLSSGGKISWMNYGEIESEQKKINGMIAKYGDKGGAYYTKQVFKSAIGTLGALNESVEMATRLSVFKALRDFGVPVDKAASISKNLSVNFNKKGTATPLINTVYLFSNAGFQSLYAGMKALKTPRGQKRAAALFGLGMAYPFMQQAIIDMVSGDDDEKDFYNNLISEEEQSNSYIIPIGDYRSVKIPKPYGMLKVFFNAGHELGALSMDGDVGEHTGNMVSTLVSSFDPITGNMSNKYSALSPTSLRPFVEVNFLNRDYNKAPILPDSYGVEESDYLRYFERTNQIYKDVAKNVYWNAGLDVSPETLEYLVNDATGGVITTMFKGIELGQVALKGTEVNPNRIPFYSKFVVDMKAQEFRYTKDFWEIYNDSKKKEIGVIKRDNAIKYAKEGNAIRKSKGEPEIIKDLDKKIREIDKNQKEVKLQKEQKEDYKKPKERK